LYVSDVICILYIARIFASIAGLSHVLRLVCITCIAHIQRLACIVCNLYNLRGACCVCIGIACVYHDVYTAFVLPLATD
jgi:hypothetical protein